MPVNLSIKNVPDELVERLRERARRHHRSLQGELMSIVENAVHAEPEKLTWSEAIERARELGIRSAAGDSAAIVRQMRDERNSR